MPRGSRATLPGPSKRVTHIRATGGDGETAVETLAERVARLEALMETLVQKMDAQLRRTGEVQAQLDRTIAALRLK